MISSEQELPEILFHQEDINFTAPDSNLLQKWIEATILNETKIAGHLNFIFCSDIYLHKINVDYLEHDTFTDIITFPYSDIKIEGDIFISIDRVRENAATFNTSFENELKRVIIHGVLHLCGYGDKTEAEAKEMRSKENQYIKLFPV